MTNTLWHCDNLHVLREHIADASVAKVYPDPPFDQREQEAGMRLDPPGALVATLLLGHRPAVAKRPIGRSAT